MTAADMIEFYCYDVNQPRITYTIYCAKSNLGLWHFYAPDVNSYYGDFKYSNYIFFVEDYVGDSFNSEFQAIYNTYKDSSNSKNDAPIAMSDTNSIVENTTTATGNVLTNDIDMQQTPESLKCLWSGTIASYGTFGGNSDGTYMYTLDNANTTVHNLNAGQTLTETFTYTAVDDGGLSSTATLTITIISTTDTGTCTGHWCEVAP